VDSGVCRLGKRAINVIIASLSLIKSGDNKSAEILLESFSTELAEVWPTIGQKMAISVLRVQADTQERHMAVLA